MIQSSIGEPTAGLRSSLGTQTHLWLARAGNWQSEAIEALLTPDEFERARTLRHPLAQENFLTGRALVRSALSHYAAVDPSAWSFASGRLGRPEITGPRADLGLRFNLSHTGGLAACVITTAADCGVDVEQIERRLRPLRIAEHSFAPEELADLKSRPSASLRERFFSYWTLKEAYYKSRGSGIPFRLGGARFELAGADGLDFLPSEDEGVAPEGWQFWLFRPTPEHVLAVAVDAGSGPRLELRCFEKEPSDGSAVAFAPRELAAERASETVSV